MGHTRLSACVPSLHLISTCTSCAAECVLCRYMYVCAFGTRADQWAYTHKGALGGQRKRHATLWAETSTSKSSKPVTLSGNVTVTLYLHVKHKGTEEERPDD